MTTHIVSWILKRQTKVVKFAPDFKLRFCIFTTFTVYCTSDLTLTMFSLFRLLLSHISSTSLSIHLTHLIYLPLFCCLALFLRFYHQYIKNMCIKSTVRWNWAMTWCDDRDKQRSNRDHGGVSENSLAHPSVSLDFVVSPPCLALCSLVLDTGQWNAKLKFSPVCPWWLS